MKYRASSPSVWLYSLTDAVSFLAAPGDRSHIAPQFEPIVDILTQELGRLRQNTPVRACLSLRLPSTAHRHPAQPQQTKIVNDTEKRLNILFDLLNNELLTEASAKRVLEICQGV